jgi:8-oxo-dGTP pyrophosphatase MutT (NUDIX family)
VRNTGAEFTFTAGLRARVLANLAAFQPVALGEDGYLRAAVGVVLLPDEANEACFVLTRRLLTLRRHGGQWALPGGRLEAGESPPQAALREIQEEIGLELQTDAILGRLDDFLTRSGHLVTPFVLWSPTLQPLHANPEEVDAAFRVPLRDLARPGNLSFEPLLHFQDLVGSSVHAPTAAILYQFLEVALHGRDVRVADIEQPFFAWS